MASCQACNGNYMPDAKSIFESANAQIMQNKPGINQAEFLGPSDF
jgi:hypothetical protein